MGVHDWENDDAGVMERDPEIKEEVSEPPMYKVLLHNDDYTPMDFVVFILREVFHFSMMMAFSTMMKVHMSGIGVVGVYPFEIAEAKISKATHLAREKNYPLLLTLEEDKPV
jgi:ATP-dependent Clp protease adaptor protein ClpS